MKNRVLLTLAWLVLIPAGWAQTPITSPVAAPAASVTPSLTRAMFVYHPATGTVLESLNATTQLGPASLTKMMTLYLVFDALKSGKIQLTTELPVSEKAWRTQGSKMFVEVGKSVPVESLIRGIAIVSGNDACVVVAEGLGGTEEGFVQLMNAKARELGMNNTTFADSNGLPDPRQVTTAQDMALLLTAIFRDFPEYKHYMAEEEFVFNGIKQQNRNGLLHAGIGIDAGKTGHTSNSGYHLASTAEMNGERLVVVVMGTNGFTEREGESMRAYRTYFSTYKTVTLAKPGQTVVANVPVWHGSLGRTALTVPQPVQAFLQAAQQSAVKAEVTYQQPLLAPLAADTIAGELKLTLPSGQQLTAPLVPAQAVPQAGFFGRFFQTLGSKFGLNS